MKDVTEFLAGIELNPDMKPLNYTITYQDSCHLAHGQKIKAAPRVAPSLRTRTGVQGDADGGPVLRQRGHLQRG